MQTFQATKQRIFSKKYFGFDIETSNYNKDFICASIVGLTKYGNKYIFKSKSKAKIIKELKTNPIFRNAVLFATNLDFDFFGTFLSTDEIGKFHRIKRGSKLLSATTYFSDNDFCYENKFKGKGKSQNRRKSLTFLDTLNYAQMSVKKMGEHIGLPKLPTPSFITEMHNWIKPRNDEEWEEMWAYNIRDSEITYRFMKFLIPAFEKLGATFKMTIASTSMSLFKNRFVGDMKIFGNKTDILKFLFEAFYGGRVETFKRGGYKHAKYYDYNSLYPSIMEKEDYPDPNTQRNSYKNTDRYIMNHEGVSDVLIEIPKMHIQPLPHKLNGLGTYPYGEIRGSYAHIELRNAIKYGAKIKKVYRSVYYLGTMRPFYEFVKVLWALRRKYQRENSPMEAVVKLLMNSLFGKFGEKFEKYTEDIHQDFITIEQIKNAIEQIGDYYIVECDEQDPKSHCIPIWAIYTTAYGRVKMHNAMMKIYSEVIYCDTDSMMVLNGEMPTSKHLGALKLEYEIKEGYSVRAKFYMHTDDENKTYIKCKGVPHNVLNKKSFLKLEKDNEVKYMRILKHRESIRRKMITNQSIPTSKVLGLEDRKRDWKGQKYTKNKLQESNPLEIKNGKIVSQTQKIQQLD